MQALSAGTLASPRLKKGDEKGKQYKYFTDIAHRLLPHLATGALLSVFGDVPCCDLINLVIVLRPKILSTVQQEREEVRVLRSRLRSDNVQHELQR